MVDDKCLVDIFDEMGKKDKNTSKDLGVNAKFIRLVNNYCIQAQQESGNFSIQPSNAEAKLETSDWPLLLKVRLQAF